MRIPNLYTDANGESHFRDIEIENPASRTLSKPVTPLSRRAFAT